MEEKSNLSLLLTSFLTFILGVVLIVATEELLISVNYVMVCIFAIIGIVQILSFFLTKDYKEGNYNSLILGTVFVWLSLFVYVYYTMIIIILPVIFSLYSFIMGVVLMIRYFMKKNWKYIALSILSFIIGIVLIFRPTLTVYTYFKITGVYVILVSIMFFIEFLNNLKTKKNN